MANDLITIDSDGESCSLPELNSPQPSSSSEKPHISIASILHSVSKNFNESGQEISTTMSAANSTDSSSSSIPQKTNFSCKLCFMTFTSNVKCLQHARVHGFLRYECSLCVSRSTTAANRNTHERLAHRLRRPEASSELIGKLSADELRVISEKDGPFSSKFFCLECNIAYMKNKDFVRHNRARHLAPEFSCSHEKTSHNYVRPVNFLQSKDPVVAKGRREMSKTVPKSRRTKLTAKKKNKKKSGKTPCKVVYPKIVNGVQQMTIDTDNDQQCRYCGIVMGNRLNRQQHELLHQNKTDFPCAVCGIWMKSVRRRSEHERVTHKHYRSRLQPPQPNATVASQKSLTVKNNQLGNEILTPMEQLQAMLGANSREEAEEKKPVIQSVIEPTSQPEASPKEASVPDLQPALPAANLKTEMELPLDSMLFMEGLTKCPTLIYYDFDFLSKQFGSLPIIHWKQYSNCKILMLRLKTLNYEGEVELGESVWTTSIPRYELARKENRNSFVVCFAKTDSLDLLLRAGQNLNPHVTFVELVDDLVSSLGIQSSLFIASKHDRVSVRHLDLNSKGIFVP
ncbi:hypothetical protein M3Y98_01223700 [Aphelenchoides besseyi]|nr:hypothetical protein M3Y98_01223700 [Aphelenchoides besseyi]